MEATAMNSKEYRASDGTVFTNLDEYRKVREEEENVGGMEKGRGGGREMSSVRCRHYREREGGIEGGTEGGDVKNTKKQSLISCRIERASIVAPR